VQNSGGSCPIKKLSTGHLSEGFNSNETQKHGLSINRPTKREKEKSSSDGHCQCQKAMDDHLLACQIIFEREPRSDKPC
jgi:hypothetical protein